MFWANLIKILDTQMPVPTAFGWFHSLFFIAAILVGVLLCLWLKDSARYAKRVMLITAVIVIACEVYKLVNFTFRVTNGTITADFPWSAFPWQFCSTPMYAGLLAGLTRGRVHRSLSAYLATFAVFAGLCVMIYPGDVFIGTIGINIQTMICHGSMLTVGIYLLGTGYVPCRPRTLLQALPVFVIAAGVAMALNEIAFRTGLLETDYFNMFYFSPHQDPHLPLYSDVQRLVGPANPLSIIIYVVGFTVAAGLVLAIAALLCRLFRRSAKQEPSL